MDKEKETNKYLEEFSEEINLLDEELKGIDNLYTELKQHFDILKNSRAKGSLTFIEKQTTNLVNMKNYKLNILKEKIGIKRTAADLDIKNKRIESEDNANDALSEKLFKLITEDHERKMQTNEEIDILGNNPDLDLEADSSEDLDDILTSKLIDSGVDIEEELYVEELTEIKTPTDEDINLGKEEEKNENEEANTTQRVADKTGTVYVINSCNEVIETLGSFEVEEILEIDGMEVVKLKDQDDFLELVEI